MNSPESPSQQHLWETGQGLASALVHDYVFSGRHEEDARQEVLLALWEATLSWQQGVHSSFEQYAYYVMRGKLFYFLTNKAEDQPTLSRKEREVFKSLRKVMRAGALISSALITQIQKDTGISAFRLQQIVSYWYTSHCSLTASVIHTLDEPSVDFDSYMLEDVDDKRLDDAIKDLPERDRIIICARYLEDPRKTLAQLSEKLGVSIERVRVLEGKSLKKLREALQPTR